MGQVIFLGRPKSLGEIRSSETPRHASFWVRTLRVFQQARSENISSILKSELTH